MYIDKFLQISKDQAVTASAPSSDSIDYGQANPNSGNNFPTYLVVTVGEAVAAAGAATLAIAIQDSADGVTFADVVVTPPIPKANLVQGQQVVIPMPVKHRRYLRANYAVATGPLTAGKLSAQVVAGYQLNTAYPDAL